MYVHIHPSGHHPTFIQHEPKQIKLDPEATVVTVWMRVASKKKQEPALTAYAINFDLPSPRFRKG